ncbi:MAG TPA: hypothetical protein VJ817_10300 [Gemmatimonadales bacterium]|nr:hypothetical protein [Gemmatimonadales bacterium]
MRQAAAFLVLTLAFAVASVLGWWAIPATAALWGLLRPIARRPAPVAAAAAALAWTGWLLVDGLSPRGDFGGLATRLAGIFSLPAPALLAITIVFAALLAGSAAYLAFAIAAARKA